MDPMTMQMIIAIAHAVEAVAKYQTLRLEKVPAAVQAEDEWAKQWLNAGKWVNEKLGIK